MPTLVIGADLCPIEGNQPHFIRGEAERLFHDLLPVFTAADLVVANLEGPFIGRPSPIRKTGPTFGYPASCLNGITAAGIDVLALANNHILDHGEAGLRHTLAACDEAGVATVGAGENIEAAAQLLIRDLDGVRVALLAVAEHEFSVAGPHRWGANPIDLIRFVRTIRSQRAEFDHLVVLYHGADEFQAPTPRVQETCRFMIEEGATAVIVQHPHMLGGIEQWHGGHIVYGQGALVMDEALYRDRASFHDGFLVRLTLGHSRDSELQLIPFRQSVPVPGARRLQDEEEKHFRKILADRSTAIADPAFVAAQWLTFCEEDESGALGSLLGHSGILRRLGLSRWLIGRLAKSRRFLGVRNMVRCETHREKLETIFDKRGF
jgi:hypothetical protein